MQFVNVAKAWFSYNNRNVALKPSTNPTQFSQNKCFMASFLPDR